MNSLSICPTETELVDLLEGNLVDPKLSVSLNISSTVLICSPALECLTAMFCKVVYRLDAPFERIANQAPRPLVDWIKRIPLLDSGVSNSQTPDSDSRVPDNDSRASDSDSRVPDSGDAQAVLDSVPSPPTPHLAV